MRWPLLLLLSPTLCLAEMRVETAAGLDTNVSHAEGDDPRSSALMRLTVEADEAARVRPFILEGSYQGGARRFQDANEEDSLSQRLEARARWPRRGIFEGLSLTTTLQERLSRDPAFPRDFTRVSAALAARLTALSTHLTLSGSLQRFDYDPNADHSFEGGAVSASLSRGWGRYHVSAGGRLGVRWFEGSRLLDAGEGLVELGEGRREDGLIAGHLSAAYQGSWVARLELSHAANQSNSARGGYRHQRLGLQATTPLYGLLISLQLNLQRLDYDAWQYLAEDAYLENETRTSVRLRVERPLSASWSLIGHLGEWFSPVAEGPEYSRRLLLLGIAYHRGP